MIGCGTPNRPGLREGAGCFNPSCGLIGCGTPGNYRHPRRCCRFQSLVRVDWLWNSQRGTPDAKGHHSFNPSCGLIGCGTDVLENGPAQVLSFNPSCGLIGCGTRRPWLQSGGCQSRCFNPSCGLIGCGTGRDPAFRLKIKVFQSLVRVDWLWNFLLVDLFLLSVRLVSIPRAG